MCVTGGVIFFVVRSYNNAETEKYQFNCRQYTNSCYHHRQFNSTWDALTYMRWQLPLIIEAYSITTHKSQSMTAHNGIVHLLEVCHMLPYQEPQT